MINERLEVLAYDDCVRRHGEVSTPHPYSDRAVAVNHHGSESWSQRRDGLTAVVEASDMVCEFVARIEPSDDARSPSCGRSISPAEGTALRYGIAGHVAEAQSRGVHPHERRTSTRQSGDRNRS